MGSIEPAPERIEQFLSDTKDGEPVVMINLLRYREQADYSGSADGVDTEACSGREAYGRYGAAVMPFIVKAGARPIWMGAVASTVISPEGERWDDAVLVEYPTRNAFIEMISSTEYQAIAYHRTAGLEDSRLIATVPGVNLLDA